MTKPQRWIVPQLWKGERVFIIAGGSSIAAQIPVISKIRGRIIAIKHAVLLRPDADILFWAGAEWHRENPWLINQHRGEMLVKRKVDETIPGWIKQVERSRPAEDGIAGFSEDRSKVGGLCAGGSALNLGVHLGAAEIVLIGFDFAGVHWLPCNRHGAQSGEHHARHREAIERMGDPIAARGVKVWNVSHKTTLEAFERAKLDEFV